MTGPEGMGAARDGKCARAHSYTTTRSRRRRIYRSGDEPLNRDAARETPRLALISQDETRLRGGSAGWKGRRRYEDEERESPLAVGSRVTSR